MNKLFLSSILGFLTVLSIVTSAHAVSITVDQSLPVSVNFNHGTCGIYDSCSGNFRIVSGSVTSRYAQPGSLSPYLTVGPYNGNPGIATFGLGSVANHFGLLWGTIDTYNSIDFLLGNSLIAHYSGGYIRNFTGNRSEAYLHFDFGSFVFDTVRFVSTSFAFESDNHYFGDSRPRPEPRELTEPTVVEVPVPSALSIFGLGLGMFGWRQKRRSNPQI